MIKRTQLMMKLWLKRFFKVLRWGAFVLGSLMLLLSFTEVPFWGIYGLSRPGADHDLEPDAIVMLGGGGMPGRDALIRGYYTALMAQKYPDALVVIALPDDTTQADNHLLRIKQELVLRGVAPSRVLFEHQGTNTRSQALHLKALLPQADKTSLLIVTDPWHVYRSIASFEKVGFQSLGSTACFESDLSASLQFSAQRIGGKTYIPDVGHNNNLRYQFWNHLIYQILLLREYTAIAYYKLQGWI